VRVLVVDDSSVMRQLMQAALASQPGWEVRAVDSGEQALIECGAQPPDVILLDAEMPGLDGAATLTALRAHAATDAVPVIMVTALEEPEARQAFADLGAMHVIQKPFAIEALAPQVIDVLASRA
jgi:DNA-binding response OmpR family regulator